MSAATARITTIRNQIGAAIATINTTTESYHVNIRDVFYVPIDIDAHASYPVVSVIMGKEKIDWQDTNFTVSHSLVECAVVGYVASATGDITSDKLMSEAGEPLLHDLKRVIADNAISHRNETVPWMITDEPWIVERFFIPGVNRGFVGIRFQIRIWAQDNDF